MYSPGTSPAVFEIDGIRFGCALCIEAEFPELFAEYERLDVDCVLLSVMVDDAARAIVAQAYGRLYGYWLGYSIPAQFSATVPSGIIAPGGRWLARCPGDGRPALAVADLDLDTTEPDIDISIRLARPWRRSARAGLYDEHTVHSSSPEFVPFPQHGDHPGAGPPPLEALKLVSTRVVPLERQAVTTERTRVVDTPSVVFTS